MVLDGPHPWGEGVPQPAQSSAGAGRVRGLLPKNPNIRDTITKKETTNHDESKAIRPKPDRASIG